MVQRWLSECPRMHPWSLPNHPWTQPRDRSKLSMGPVPATRDGCIFILWFQNGQAQVIQMGIPKADEERDESEMMINKFQLINLFAPLEVKEHTKGRGRRRNRQEVEEEEEFEVVPKHSTLAAYTVRQHLKNWNSKLADSTFIKKLKNYIKDPTVIFKLRFF